MPTGLELARAANPLDREARRDGHSQPARCDQAGDLLQGAAGRVRAVDRGHAVDLPHDGADAAVRDAADARELLGELPPAVALRRWMDLFGDWIATRNGMLDTLLTMIESGEIAHARTRTELLTAITTILDAGRAAGDLRSDASAADIAASLIGIFAVAPRPEHEAKAGSLLNLLMGGLRSTARPPGLSQGGLGRV